MISILVCSIRPQQVAALEHNLGQTVGVGFELLVRDNRATGEGICSVYNQLAAQAKGDLLCFVHEDVAFETPGWGERLAALLARPEVGVVGVAGANLLNRLPSGWADSGPSYRRMHLTQQDGERRYPYFQQPEGETESPVVVLDGVFLACRKEVWQAHPFDEATFDGFHFYDLDFSLSVFQSGLVNLVSAQMDLVHFSRGAYNTTWVRYAEVFYRKWAGHLPAAVSMPDAPEIRKSRAYNLYNYCRLLIRCKAPEDLIRQRMEQFATEFPLDIRQLLLTIKKRVRPLRHYDTYDAE